MGEWHCNKVVKEDGGFRVAGQGITPNENFWLPVWTLSGARSASHLLFRCVQVQRVRKLRRHLRLHHGQWSVKLPPLGDHVEQCASSHRAGSLLMASGWCGYIFVVDTVWSMKTIGWLVVNFPEIIYLLTLVFSLLCVVSSSCCYRRQMPGSCFVFMFHYSRLCTQPIMILHARVWHTAEHIIHRSDVSVNINIIIYIVMHIASNIMLHYDKSYHNHHVHITSWT
jgi:hypothetical protein